MLKSNFIAVNLSLCSLSMVFLLLLQIATVCARATNVLLLSSSIDPPESVKSSQCCAPVFLAPVFTSGSNVYVSWSSNKTGESFEIMFRASTDDGKTFGTKINLSNSPLVDSLDPSIAVSGSNVYVSWWESANKTSEPVIRISNDNGKTFGPIMRLQSTVLLGNSSEG
jgi:hypothetical protein